MIKRPDLETIEALREKAKRAQQSYDEAYAANAIGARGRREDLDLLYANQDLEAAILPALLALLAYVRKLEGGDRVLIHREALECVFFMAKDLDFDCIDGDNIDECKAAMQHCALVLDLSKGTT